MLTDPELKNLPPRSKPFKKADERGLFVIVRPDGSIHWRFKYRFGGREKGLSFGVYRGADTVDKNGDRKRGRVDVSLKRAREKREGARQLLDRGIDPSAKRKAEGLAHANTFKAIAEEWLENGCPPSKAGRALDPGTLEQLRARLGRYLYREIGQWPITEISAADLLRVLRKIEKRGKHETAHRVRSLAGRVFRYAINTGRAERDISSDLKDALVPVGMVHFPAITKLEPFGALLTKIDEYQGQPATRAALKILALTFVRPGELRLATWDEIDLDAAQWDIPAERTKLRRDHVVPLSTQAVAILRELQKLTDKGPASFIFPSLRPGRPLSDNTLNMALRAMDIDTKTEHCSHGFRSSASTLLHEKGFESDVIECQLAHKRSGVGGIYNRAHRLKDRRSLMQSWATCLDELKASKN